MSVVFVAAMFMSIMDTTIVNVALPTIGRDFSVSSTAVDSVSIAFLVSLAVFIPASGWLGDRFGGKRVLLTAIAVFSVASAVGGAIGVALLTTAIVLIGTTHLVAGHEVANLTAYRIAFLVAAAFCLAGVASALSIHDTDAAATIPSRRHNPQWPASAVARVWHHPAATPDDKPLPASGSGRSPVLMRAGLREAGGK